MFSYQLPIPFIESKGSTWNIQMGYPLNPNDCSCDDTTTSTSGSTDMTGVEDRLDDILAAMLTSNSSLLDIELALVQLSGSTDTTAMEQLLTDIRAELQQQNADVEQTTIFVTTGGTIPAGVQSYTIINLGIDPTDPASAANAMIINGLSINTKIISYGNSTDTNQVLIDPITYDPNGNTLFITYNMPI